MCRHEWVAWCKSGVRPRNMPSHPNKVYVHGGWRGYGHWLGTSNLAGGKQVEHAHSDAAGSTSSHSDEDARPANIPSNPNKTYKRSGWQGYHHWLGIGIPTAVRNPMFMPFTKALLYARSLKLNGHKEWQAWSKSGSRPANMPSDPGKIYKHEGWEGWGHWLDSANPHTKVFMPFNAALLCARSLKLKTQKEWMAWCKSGARPANIPSSPDRTYRHMGWEGVGHWLGTGNVGGGHRQEFLPFKKALLYARSLKLKGQKDWRAWCKSGARPANIPSHPDLTYTHKGWQGYGHWLGTGTGTIAPKDQKFLPFKKALLYARSLKLNHGKEWKEWCKSGARPANVPADPYTFYKHAGWQGYGHWLRTGVRQARQAVPTCTNCQKTFASSNGLAYHTQHKVCIVKREAASAAGSKSPARRTTTPSPAAASRPRRNTPSADKTLSPT